MKNIANYLSTIALILSGFLITSWVGHNSSLTDNIADTPLSTAENSIFSYKIDGKLYSWSGNDPYANQATINSKGEVFFTPMSNDPAEKNPPQFGFGVAAVWPHIDSHSSHNI